MKIFWLAGLFLALSALQIGAAAAQSSAPAQPSPTPMTVTKPSPTTAIDTGVQFSNLRKTRNDLSYKLSLERQRHATLQAGLELSKQKYKGLDDELDDEDPLLSLQEIGARIEEYKLALKSPPVETSPTAIYRVRQKIEQYQQYQNNYTAYSAQWNKQNSALVSRKEAADKEVKDTENKLLRLQTNIQDDEKNLADAEDSLNSLLNNFDVTSGFKTRMSLIFAVLVGLVILGFFCVAIWDNNVRRSIFSNDTGIQFITLFSLVIAIILFGIIGILESKELSALLGGLSGYILGRATSSQARPTDT
jgi:hypothetical protein